MKIIVKKYNNNKKLIKTIIISFCVYVLINMLLFFSFLFSLYDFLNSHISIIILIFINIVFVFVIIIIILIFIIIVFVFVIFIIIVFAIIIIIIIIIIVRSFQLCSTFTMFIY